MTDELEGFYSAVDALDEEKLERRAEVLRAQQDAVNRELVRVLDALELKRRWRTEGGVPQRPLGRIRDGEQRVAVQARPGSLQATDDSPRGTEAIRRVMQDGGTWNVQKLYEELARRGWINPEAQNPEKATETALHRLYNKGELARTGRGIYRYRSLDERQAETETGRAEP